MALITISIIIATLCGAAAVITFWDNVREWVEKSIFPFLKNHFPEYESIARNAFAKLDGIVVRTRNIRKKAWEKLRELLLKTVVSIEKVSSSEATRKVKSWLVSSLEKGTVKVRITEEELHMDDVPRDVADAFIKRGVKNASEDFTKHRDEEFLKLEMQT